MQPLLHRWSNSAVRATFDDDVHVCELVSGYTCELIQMQEHAGLTAGKATLAYLPSAVGG